MGGTVLVLATAGGLGLTTGSLDWTGGLGLTTGGLTLVVPATTGGLGLVGTLLVGVSVGGGLVCGVVSLSADAALLCNTGGLGRTGVAVTRTKGVGLTPGLLGGSGFVGGPSLVSVSCLASSFVPSGVHNVGGFSTVGRRVTDFTSSSSTSVVFFLGSGRGGLAVAVGTTSSLLSIGVS